MLPDTAFVVTHNKKSKRLIVTAKTKDGKPYKVKYKVVADNKVRITSSGDSAKIKVSITPKQPL